MSNIDMGSSSDGSSEKYLDANSLEIERVEFEHVHRKVSLLPEKVNVVPEDHCSCLVCVLLARAFKAPNIDPIG